MTSDWVGLTRPFDRPPSIQFFASNKAVLRWKRKWDEEGGVSGFCDVPTSTISSVLTTEHGVPIRGDWAVADYNLQDGQVRMEAQPRYEIV